MDVRFCERRNHQPRGTTCATVDPDQTNNALSRAPHRNLVLSLDKDLHGPPSTDPNPTQTVSSMA